MKTLRTRRLAPLGLVLSAALLGACATGTDVGEADPLVDEVYRAIRLDPSMESSQVTVTHQGGGVVALNGFISNLTDQRSLVEAAEGVEGVTRVENNLTFQAD